MGRCVVRLDVLELMIAQTKLAVDGARTSGKLDMI